jgi:hypothetical protein
MGFDVVARRNKSGEVDRYLVISVPNAYSQRKLPSTFIRGLAYLLEIRNYGREVTSFGPRRDNHISGDLSNFDNFDCHYSASESRLMTALCSGPHANGDSAPSMPTGAIISSDTLPTTATTSRMSEGRATDQGKIAPPEVKQPDFQTAEAPRSVNLSRFCSPCSDFKENRTSTIYAYGSYGLISLRRNEDRR